MNAAYWRVKWMRVIGMGSLEIVRHLFNDPPLSTDEERKQYEAALRITQRKPKL